MTKKETGQFILFLLANGGLIFAITRIPIPKVEAEQAAPGAFQYEFTIVK